MNNREDGGMVGLQSVVGMKMGKFRYFRSTV